MSSIPYPAKYVHDGRKAYQRKDGQHMEKPAVYPLPIRGHDTRGLRILLAAIGDLAATAKIPPASTSADLRRLSRHIATSAVLACRNLGVLDRYDIFCWRTYIDMAVDAITTAQGRLGESLEVTSGELRHYAGNEQQSQKAITSLDSACRAVSSALDDLSAFEDAVYARIAAAITAAEAMQRSHNVPGQDGRVALVKGRQYDR